MDFDRRPGLRLSDGRTTFELLYPVANFASSDPYSTALPRLTRAVAGQRVHGAPVRVTGATILSSAARAAAAASWPKPSSPVWVPW